MNHGKLWTKDFISVSLTNFFLFLTFYFLLVTMPVFSIQKFHSSASQAGLMTTAFMISAIISRPFAGKWMGRSGYRKGLLIALLISLSSSLLYFFPKSMIGFLTIRLLHGIGFGIATTAAGAIVSNMIPNSRQGEGMGYFIMSSNLAMVLGPFFGLTIIQSWGTNSLFILNIFCAASALMVALMIKAPKTTEQHPGTSSKKFSLTDFFEISALPISIVAAFFVIIYSSLLSFVSLYAKELHLMDVSVFFFIVYAAVLLIARPFVGRWFDLYGANRIVYPSILFYAVGIFILSETHGAGSFLLSAGVIGLGWGTLFPLFQTIAIQNAPSHRKGLATATFLSACDTGLGLAPFFVGLVVANTGFRSFYLISTVYILAGVILYYFLHPRKNDSIKKIEKKQQSHIPF